MPKQKPSSHALRRGRASLQNQIYLVTFTTKDRKHRFKNFQSARLLINVLNKPGHIKTLAFVVMPDHVHWLIQLLDETPLGKVLCLVKSVSARQINQHLGRKGQFWQDGYHDHALRREEALINVARYIVANPLRAGLVKKAADYPHWDAIWV